MGDIRFLWEVRRVLKGLDGAEDVPSEQGERGRDSRSRLPRAPTLIFDFGYRSTGAGVFCKCGLEVPKVTVTRLSLLTSFCLLA